MDNLSPDQRFILNRRLAKFSPMAHSARQIAEEESRILQEIKMDGRKSQIEERKRQAEFDVLKDLALSAKRQADIAESSARSAKTAMHITYGLTVVSIVVSILIPLIEFLFRR
ncbi:MAG: hypothetical protein KIT56_03535 [Gammaproteobacteria bacterium]|nr:hypothetical protein [Gammaproteobacteria bacterium]MCW5582950.1 hypothetical protein [Gammaproteobacteria bacterium]